MSTSFFVAADWLAAWNAHDVEGVLRHFHEDAVFASPFAAQVMPETGGRLVGKAALNVLDVLIEVNLRVFNPHLCDCFWIHKTHVLTAIRVDKP